MEFHSLPLPTERQIDFPELLWTRFLIVKYSSAGKIKFVKNLIIKKKNESTEGDHLHDGSAISIGFVDDEKDHFFK